MTRGEFAWIERLAETLGPTGDVAGGAGIGDDAAILPVEGSDPWAWTVDALVENVHFRFDWLDPEAVGWRALAAGLSDLAAAGATAVAAVVTAAGPIATIEARLEGIYRGIAALSRRSGCAIVGGDLSRAAGPLHVTVGALGRVAGGDPLGRTGARPGDGVWVTGALGGPAAAVDLLHAATGPAPDPDRAPPAPLRDHAAYARLAAPEPRLAEIAWIRARVPVRAAIDLSDGLSGDAAHVARRSGVRIALEPGRVPIHEGALAAAEARGEEALAWALHGGEEFELLLVVPDGALEPHAEAFEARFGLPVTKIGRVAEGAGVTVLEDGRERPLAPASWDHFA